MGMKKALALSVLLTLSAVTKADVVDDVRNAALANQCLESVVSQLIQARGLGQAANIVAAAYLVLGELANEQKSLGCTGDIGQAAIVAGADPAEVLEATAAGAGNGPLSAPAGLGDPGVIGATGFFASPS